MTSKDLEFPRLESHSMHIERSADGDGVVVVEFAQAHPQNPFSSPRMAELTDALRELDRSAEVGCIVLYGGRGRSFAAGGDFNETAGFVGGTEVERWVDHIADLYSTILALRCPVIAAVDGHAIGIGLQIALCCDLRLGSREASLTMPEFRLGIACNFGGFLLESVVGRSVMQEMLFTCEPWNSDRALAAGLLHLVVGADELLSTARKRAQVISGYTRSAVQETRPRLNRHLISGLESVREQGKVAHRAAFAAGEAQERMREVLQRSALA